MKSYYVIPTGLFGGNWTCNTSSLDEAKRQALANHSPCVIVEKIGEFIHEQPTKVWKDENEF